MIITTTMTEFLGDTKQAKKTHCFIAKQTKYLIHNSFWKCNIHWSTYIDTFCSNTAQGGYEKGFAKLAILTFTKRPLNLLPQFETEERVLCNTLF